jgi:hypothetical protein
MVAGDDGGPISGRLACQLRHSYLAGSAKILKVKARVMTLNSPHGSNLGQTDELNRSRLQQRKAWIKPEFRQLEFMATASAGGGGNDGGAQPS